jgi:Transposase DDE domain
VLAELDALLTALYVAVDDLLPARAGPSRRPRLTDAELITLAVAQIFLDCPSERRFLRFARRRLGHLFPYIPKQPGYNKRLRRLAPQICLRHRPPGADLAVVLRPPQAHRFDPRAVRPVARDRQALRARRPRRLRLVRRALPLFLGLQALPAVRTGCDAIAFALAPANEPEREVAAAVLERARRGELLQGGELIVGDKGFAGEEFEQIVASLDAELIRPDRRDERPRFGSLGGLRQWIESVIDTLKGQFSLERHGGHTVEGVWVRVCQRVLALAAGCRHNWEIGKPGRGFTAYDH